MKTLLRFGALSLLAAVLALAACSGKRAYPYRWVYVTALLDDQSEVDKIGELARRAAAHGLNGFVVFSRQDSGRLEYEDLSERMPTDQSVIPSAS